MSDTDRVHQIRLAEQAALYQKNDPTFSAWAAGYGPIQHSPLTQVRVRAMADLLSARGILGDGVPIFAHAERYDFSEHGLARYVRDFYSYHLRADGTQDSPLGRGDSFSFRTSPAIFSCPVSDSSSRPRASLRGLT